MCTSAGSIALGVALGFVFGVLYRKLTAADVLLIFLGTVLLLGSMRDYLANEWHLSFNFLLTCLFIGSTFTNITPGQEAFYNALRSISGPIFALFFVLAGFELHLAELPHIGLLGLGYVVFRIFGENDRQLDRLTPDAESRRTRPVHRPGHALPGWCRNWAGGFPRVELGAPPPKAFSSPRPLPACLKRSFWVRS